MPIDSDDLRNLQRGDPVEYGLDDDNATRVCLGYYLSHDTQILIVGDKCILRDTGLTGHKLSTQDERYGKRIAFRDIVYLNRLTRELRFGHGRNIESGPQ